MHTELPLLKDRGFAATIGNAAAITSDDVEAFSRLVVVEPPPSSSPDKPVFDKEVVDEPAAKPRRKHS